jgi:hypothetical protein
MYDWQIADEKFLSATFVSRGGYVPDRPNAFTREIAARRQAYLAERGRRVEVGPLYPARLNSWGGAPPYIMVGGELFFFDIQLVPPPGTHSRLYNAATPNGQRSIIIEVEDGKAYAVFTRMDAWR